MDFGLSIDERWNDRGIRARNGRDPAPVTIVRKLSPLYKRRVMDENAISTDVD
jgi:hypothetical protein